MKSDAMNKREPYDEYDCWCMSCKECVHYDEISKKCNHPECYEDSELHP